MNFFGKELNSYKAILHCHSTRSDGKFSPQDAIKLYREAGYDIMALTDHNTPPSLEGLDSMGMCLLPGAEIHPMNPRHNMRWHIVALGIPGDFNCDHDQEAQEVVTNIKAADGYAICAHPYWCGFDMNDLQAIRGFDALEIFNTSCIPIGRSVSDMVWDEMLQAGHRLSATAVDDMHTREHAFQGWINILAEENTPEAVMNALKKGCFYSSRGPEIYRLSYENNIFEAEFSPCTEVVVVSKYCYGQPFKLAHVPNADGTNEITSIKFDFTGWFPTPGYFRLQMFDRNHKYAWTNPIYLD